MHVREISETVEAGSALVPAAGTFPGYELRSLLGQGAFGQVWSAVQTRTGQEVALKVLTGRSGLDWSYFQHELRMLRSVAEHPHVVTLLDADLEHDPAFIVMPLLRGLSAGASRDEIVLWLEQIAKALQFTHARGILHCDLKPPNVLLDAEGQARVADFGQARPAGGALGALGTIGFMPPGQLSGSESPDVGWDIYAWGATAYFLLSGSRPRLSEADLQAVRASADGLGTCREMLLRNPLVPLRGVDGELAAIVEGCLHLEPGRRTQSAAAILEDLERRRRGAPLLCRRPWSMRYRLGRFLRKPAVALSLFVPFFLLLFVNSNLTVRAAQALQREALEHLRDVHYLARGQIEMGRLGGHLGPEDYRHYLVDKQGHVSTAFNDLAPPPHVNLAHVREDAPFLDDKGQEVLAQVAHVGDFTLLTEVSTERAYRDADALRQRNLLLTLLIVVVTGGVGLLVFRATGGDH